MVQYALIPRILAALGNAHMLITTLQRHHNTARTVVPTQVLHFLKLKAGDPLVWEFTPRGTLELRRMPTMAQIDAALKR